MRKTVISDGPVGRHAERIPTGKKSMHPGLFVTRAMRPCPSLCSVWKVCLSHRARMWCDDVLSCRSDASARWPSITRPRQSSAKLDMVRCDAPLTNASTCSHLSGVANLACAKLDYSGIWLAPRKSFHPATPVAWSVRPTPIQLLQHDSMENIPACVVSNDLSCDVWSQASHRPTLRSSLHPKRLLEAVSAIERTH